MNNKFILTPYYLDQSLPGLESLVDSDLVVNQLHLSEGNAQDRMGVLYQPLADFVFKAISRGERPVSIAGDCCTSIGVMAGLQRAGTHPTLIWFDAHGDFNTWETTPSFFLGGMPLAMLIGLGEQTILEAVDLKPIPESQTILTDARDLDQGEKEALASSKVVHISNVEDLSDYPLSEGEFYIHFDTDIINPIEAPAMNYPAPGGPNVKTLGRIFQRLAQTGRVIAVSLSSWNPGLDSDGRTKTAVMDLLEYLLDR
jgi:arginase